MNKGYINSPQSSQRIYFFIQSGDGDWIKAYGTDFAHEVAHAFNLSVSPDKLKNLFPLCPLYLCGKKRKNMTVLLSVQILDSESSMLDNNLIVTILFYPESRETNISINALPPEQKENYCNVYLEWAK